MICSDMKNFIAASLSLILWLPLNAQTAADYDARLNPIQTYQRNNPAYLNQPAQSESQTVEIVAVIWVSSAPSKPKTGFGYHLGFASRLYYSNKRLTTTVQSMVVACGKTHSITHFLGSYDLGGPLFPRSLDCPI